MLQDNQTIVHPIQKFSQQNTNQLQFIKGFIEVLSSPPTFIPKTFYDSIKIYGDSLYVYNQKLGTWLSSGLGNMIQNIGTTLPSAPTNSGQFYYLTTTDTIYRSNGTAWIALN